MPETYLPELWGIMAIYVGDRGWLRNMPLAVDMDSYRVGATPIGNDIPIKGIHLNPRHFVLFHATDMNGVSKYHITDVSTSGTWVNGVRCARGRKLAIYPGAKIATALDNKGYYFELRDGSFDAFSLEYTFSGRIGQGSFGSVYKAERLATGKSYAVKVLRKLPFPPINRRNAPILKEVFILQGLGHKNVVNLHAVYESQKDIFIVMELMRYGDLDGLIRKRNSLDETTSRLSLREITSGLEYLHSCNIIHRDVKPQSLTSPLEVDRFRHIKGGDRQIVFEGCSSVLCQTICGTPMYMAPEIYAPGAKVDHSYDFKVDSWSLGVTLFRMLCGRYPFRTEDEPVAPDYEDKLCGLLRKLLVHDSKQRLSIAEVEQHPWTNVGRPSTTQKEKSAASTSIRLQRMNLAHDASH
ncbi:kinase-like protein [Coniophora puteana RWD-64-598 SS2]|uniref:Kinase-like protein n=1 Tax=Coniophora puteana (strain RWD-64-598) TaxID=741705 RepID=A0A5M3MFH5_CONPW|nr:kinase-like protein [Coniophora puteana RWD-64-598 SS2]EIW77534.1 kinase-like protein [Coniophora puteana RWD-64-598 SS2]